MNSRARPTITVQQCWRQEPGDSGYVTGMIRMRGNWVLDVFDLGTKLRVTREERQGKIVLILEPITEPAPHIAYESKN